VQIRSDYWEAYQRVNRKFAQAAANAATDDDFIWVHDYHLMSVARYLREAGSRARMGFFLHIPFPAPDIFEKLPWRQCILKSLLQFDLIGFQTDRDRNNFVSCLQRLLPEATVEQNHPHLLASMQGRQAVVGTFPISIDFEEFAIPAAHPDVAARAENIRKQLLDNVLVLGVDRMDYTKGIPERLKSFRLLLRRFPELRRQITLVQVVVPAARRFRITKNYGLRSNFWSAKSMANSPSQAGCRSITCTATSGALNYWLTIAPPILRSSLRSKME